MSICLPKGIQGVGESVSLVEDTATNPAARDDTLRSKDTKRHSFRNVNGLTIWVNLVLSVYIYFFSQSHESH